MSNLSYKMIIFGGTGDLTKRKLIPAIHELGKGKYLPKEFKVIGIGRRGINQEEYSNMLYKGITEYTNIETNPKLWNEISKKIYYLKMDFTKPSEYKRLYEYLLEDNKKEKISSNLMFYLAVSPEYFGGIVNNLKENNIIDEDNQWNRMVIEKPFGKNFKSAKKLNNEISKVFKENQIFRIDHYLGKEMIQNITMLRFENSIFEPIWNNKHIENIQIIVSEKQGIGLRGEYYDNTGALKDMIQSHLLQILAVTTMEYPKNFHMNSIRNAKAKLLEDLVFYTDDNNKENIIFGQYEGYNDEERISQHSNRETFVAMKVFIKNKRWQGVPIYLMTGKKLKEKLAQVNIEFKRPQNTMYDNSEINSLEINKTPKNNVLEIMIQPKEGIGLRINIKKPTVMDEMEVAEMEYCRTCLSGLNTPDAYVKLLLDVIEGDSTRFTRWDELSNSWKFIDSINEDLIKVHKYKPRGLGPEKAYEMISEDNRKWWFLNKWGEHNENI
ncbi:MAG: glucose-6-phosphate dehydrogenase [Eubacteriales bacterium]